MINYERIDEYRNTSVLKQYVFRVEDESGRWVADFGNTNIVGESMELKDTLCSEEQLTFGSCEASEISFTTTDTESVSVIDKLLYCSTFPGYAVMGTPTVNLGAFRITEDKLSSDRLKRSIKAVDLMYDILNADVTEWYNGLTFPMTLKAFRDSFFEHIGFTQEETTLVNDSMLVSKTLSTNQLLGSTVIKAICEANGVFGKMSRRTYTPKVFKYVDLKGYSKSALYPREDLYPSESLYPSGMDISEYQAFDVDQYFTVDYANYVSNEEGLDKLIIRQEENDIGVTVGDGSTFDNVYVVQNNFLLYGLNASELTTVATNLYNKIKYTTYVPLTAVVRGNPCLEVGDAISIKNGDKILNTFILERSLKGLEALKDTYSARGVDKYRGEANGINAQINQLRGKTTKIKADVEGLSVEVSDLEESTTSRFQQTNNEISAEVTRATGAESGINASLQLKVDKDDNDQVVSMINASANVITLNSNRFVVNSDKFQVTAEGDMSCSNANITGGNITIKKYHSELYGDMIMELSPTGFKTYYSTPLFNYQSAMSPEGLLLKGVDNVRSFQVFEGSAATHGSIEAREHEFFLRNSAPNYSSSIEMILNASNNYSLNCNNASLVVVGGTKSKAVETENFGTRLLYCYETPTPYFGDIGEGVTDEIGECYIYIDDIFAETVETDCEYQVFLQKYGKGDIWVEERNKTYFVVKGDKNLKFAWEIKLKQKDYEAYRLDNFEREEQDYVEEDN